MSEKGVAEQGTLSLCCPAFPSLPLLSLVPISAHVATTRQQAAAAIPVPPARKLDGRLVLSEHSIFARVVFQCFTITEILWFIQAREMHILLSDILRTLNNGDTDIKMKALLVFRNLLRHMKRKEASHITLQLAGKLLPLIDDVRLLWEPEPHRWVLCKDSCPPAQPRRQDLGRAASLLTPLGSRGMASGLCSPVQLLLGRLMPLGDPIPLRWGLPLCKAPAAQELLGATRAPPDALSGKTRHSPQALWKGAEAEPAVCVLQALLRGSLVSSSARPRGMLL